MVRILAIVAAGLAGAPTAQLPATSTPPALISKVQLAGSAVKHPFDVTFPERREAAAQPVRSPAVAGSRKLVCGTTVIQVDQTADPRIVIKVPAGRFAARKIPPTVCAE